MSPINNLYQDARHNQPTINVGMIGSVSNGKSSLTKTLTGIKTQKHSSENERNITIKLGYANIKIYQCPTCPKPQCYQNYASDVFSATCKICQTVMELKKHISFVDCPGHNLLMATMLNGACVMDSSIIVESVANNDMPAEQTAEHLIATNIMELDSAFACMNKIDITNKNNTIKNMNKLNDYIKEKKGKSLPIVPISANLGINTDVVCEYICDLIKEPERDLESDAKMIIIRSFNINKQNTKISNLQGGVVGGTLIQGILNINDTVEILPGFLSKIKNKWCYKPIIATIESINSEKNNLEKAIPGGLIGVKLSVDPSLTASDGLVGSTLIKYNGKHNENYKVYDEIFIVLEKTFRENNTKLKKNDTIIINYNAYNVKGNIIKIKNNKMKIELIDRPLCVTIGDYVTVSKPINNDMQNTILLGRAIIKLGSDATQV